MYHLLVDLMQCVTNKTAQHPVNASLIILAILMKDVGQSVSLIPIARLIKLVLDPNVRTLVQDSVDTMQCVKLLIMFHYVPVNLDIPEIRSFNVTLFKHHVSVYVRRNLHYPKFSYSDIFEQCNL